MAQRLFSFQIDDETVQVPLNEVGAFKSHIASDKRYEGRIRPIAMFEHEGESVGIRSDEVEAFQAKFPNAKPIDMLANDDGSQFAIKREEREAYVNSIQDEKQRRDTARQLMPASEQARLTGSEVRKGMREQFVKDVKDGPVGDLIEGAVDAYTTLWDTLPASFYQMNDGLVRPDKYSPKAIAAFERADKRIQANQAKTEEKKKIGTSTVVGSTLRESGNSIAFSLATMVPTIVGSFAGAKVGALTGAATVSPAAAISGPAAPAVAGAGAAVGAAVGGFAGGAAASYAAGYRMAGNAFLYEAFKDMEAESMKTNKRPMNEAEKDAAYKTLLPIAENTALWEAGPEAIGNAVTLGAGKMVFGVGKPLVGSFARKFALKAAAVVGSQAVELGGETLTQVEQNADQLKADAIAQGKDHSNIKADWTSKGVGEAFKEVAPTTLGLGVLMWGAGGAASGSVKVVQNAKTAIKNGATYDSVITDFGSDEKSLRGLSVADKHQIVTSIVKGLSTEESRKVIKSEKAQMLYEKLADKAGFNFAEESKGIESQFRLPNSGNWQNVGQGAREITDSNTGITIRENPDGTIDVIDKSRKQQAVAESPQQAIEIADKMSIYNQTVDRSRERKIGYLQDLSQRLAGNMRFQAFHTAEELIAEHGEELGNNESFSRNAAGVRLKDGTVAIVLDNVGSPYEMIQTVLHEGGLHGGLREMYQDEGARKDFLKQIDKGAIQQGLNLVEKMGYDPNSEVGIEEALAYLYEKRTANPSAYQKAVAVVHGQLRKVFPKMQFTKSDVDVLVSRMQQKVRGEAGGLENMAGQLDGEDSGANVYESPYTGKNAEALDLITKEREEKLADANRKDFSKANEENEAKDFYNEVQSEERLKAKYPEEYKAALDAAEGDTESAIGILQRHVRDIEKPSEIETLERNEEKARASVAEKLKSRSELSASDVELLNGDGISGPELYREGYRKQKQTGAWKHIDANADVLPLSKETQDRVEQVQREIAEQDVAASEEQAEQADEDSKKYGTPPEKEGVEAPIVATTSDPKVMEKTLTDFLQDDRLPENMPVDDINVQLPGYEQFKKDANPTTGEVAGQELKGEIMDVDMKPIIVLQLNNGKKVVVTGRHRLGLFKRNGRKTIPAKLLYESEGVTPQIAHAIDAISNILDEKGTISDYIEFFRETNITDEEAQPLLSRPSARTAFSIFKDSSILTQGAIDWEGTGDGITPEQAGVISAYAPMREGDANRAVQALGVKKAKNGMKPKQLAGYMQAMVRFMKLEVERGNAPQASQDDMFAGTDFDVGNADSIASQEGVYTQAKAKEYAGLRAMLASAVKNPDGLRLTAEQAKELGIKDRKDKGQLQNAWNEADRLSKYWDKGNLELADMVAMRKELGLSTDGLDGEVKGKASTAVVPKVENAEKAESAVPSTPKPSISLAGQTKAEVSEANRAKKAEQGAEARRKAAEKKEEQANAPLLEQDLLVDVGSKTPLLDLTVEQRKNAEKGEKKAEKESVVKPTDYLNDEAKRYQNEDDFIEGEKGIISRSDKTFEIKFSDGKSVTLNKKYRNVGGVQLQELEASLDGKFVGVRFHGDGETLTIIGLANESKGKGYGTEILDTIIQSAKDSGYTKIVANDIRTTDSLGYWVKHGFAPKGINASLDVVPTSKQKLSDIWNQAHRVSLNSKPDAVEVKEDAPKAVEKDAQKSTDAKPRAIDVAPASDEPMSLRRIVKRRVGDMGNIMYGGAVVSVPRLGEYYGTRENTSANLMEIVASVKPEIIKKYGLVKFDNYADAVKYAEGTDAESQKPTATEPTQAGKLEDFGEKLGGARKDKISSVEQEISDDELATKTFSEIWPKSEVTAIEDNDMAAIATALRAVVPSKPRKGYKVARWVERVKQVRELMRFANEFGFDGIMARMAEPKHRLSKFVDKVNLLRQLPREHWDRIGEVENYPDAYQYETVDGKMTGNKIPTPHAVVEVDGRRVRASSLEDAVGVVTEKLTVDKVESSMQFEVRGRKGSLAINKKGDPLYRKLKTFTDTEDVKVAFAYIKNNRADLVQAWENVKESDNVKETDVRREENKPRTGADHRKGKDATPQMFSDSFGFRGVEFGNWVSQGKNTKERQGMLNAAYDALMDLADIVGVPPAALSLNGQLGLGFGSRGHGKASAHYEPSNIVINLTKPRGAGALAHEWFHALDHYFQRSRPESGSVSREDNFITYQPEAYYEHTRTKDRLSAARFNRIKEQGRFDATEWKRIEGVRPEVEVAFYDLVKALDDSPMNKRSQLIDSGKSGGYWSRIIERAARAFENYTIFKMQQMGYNNDYLANVATVNEFVRDKDRYPYLLDGEIKPVAEAFDNLFGTIKTKETDKGVAMFRLSDKARAEQTDTPQFKTWFKDSKVVDDEGKPLVVYHGTPFGNFRERAKAINLFRKTAKENAEAINLKIKAETEAIDAQLRIVRDEKLLLEKEQRDNYMRLWGNESQYSRKPADNSKIDLKYQKDFMNRSEVSRKAEESLSQQRRDVVKNRISDTDIQVLSHQIDEADSFTKKGDNDYGYLGKGYYFTADEAVAKEYAEHASRGTIDGEKRDRYVYETYLSMQNPWFERVDRMTQEMADYEAERTSYYERFFRSDDDGHLQVMAIAKTETLQHFGYDGVIGESHGKEGVEYVVFDSTQIKSATDNTGSFDSANPDVRFRISDSARASINAAVDIANETDNAETQSRAQHASIAISKSMSILPEPIAKLRDLYIEYQSDSRVPVERLYQRVMRNNPNAIYNPDKHAYKQAREFSGSEFDNKQTKLSETYVQKIVSDYMAGGWNMEDLDKFVQALHAPYRNKQIAEIRGGAMSPDLVVLGELATTPEQLLKTLETDGWAGRNLSDEESARTIAMYSRMKGADKLKSAADKLVEMNRFIIDQRVADGLMSEAQAKVWKELSPYYVPLKVAHDQDDLVNASGGRNLASRESKQAKGHFGKENESSFINSLIQADQATTRGLENQARQKLWNFLEANPNHSAYKLHERLPKKTIVVGSHTEGNRKVKSVDDSSFALEQHVISVKFDGDVRYIEFIGDGRKQLGRAIRENALAGRTFARISRPIMSFYKMTRTTDVFDFIFRNGQNDGIDAFINMASEGLTKESVAAAKKLPRVWKMIAQDKFGRNVTGKYLDHYKLYKESNGKMGSKWVDSTGKVWTKEIDKMMGVNATPKLLHPVVAIKDNIETLNEVVEVSTRFSVFSALIDAGWHIDDASEYARNITVDFEKRGNWSPITNAIWAFQTVGINSVVRFSKAVRGKNGKKIIGSLLAGGFINATINILLSGIGGDDEEDPYAKIQQFKKKNKAFVGIPGTPLYLTPRLRGPAGAIWFIGTSFAEAVFGKMSWLDFSKQVPDTLIGSINQFGDSHGFSQKVAPSFLAQPIVQHEMNATWTGQEVVPGKKMPWNAHKPQSELYYESTGKGYVWLAKKINELGQGDEITKGKILGVESDISPETFKLITEHLTGSLLRFPTRSLGVVLNLFKKEDVQLRSIPVVSDFVANANDISSSGIYYDAKDKFEESMYRFNEYEKAGKHEEKWKVVRENPYMNNRGYIKKEIKEIADDIKLAKKNEKEGVDSKKLMEDIEKRKLHIANLIIDHKRTWLERKVNKRGK